MADTAQKQDQQTISAEASLAGILALLVSEREQRAKNDKDMAKTEVLLGRAGVHAEDIAIITGKNVGAVRKALQRAKAN